VHDTGNEQGKKPYTETTGSERCTDCMGLIGSFVGGVKCEDNMCGKEINSPDFVLVIILLVYMQLLATRAQIPHAHQLQQVGVSHCLRFRLRLLLRYL
jgi:hypothetical protein